MTRGRAQQSDLGSAPEGGRRRPEAVLQGLRVLIVEDELLLGLELHDDLETLGCAVIGPFGTLAQAFEEAQQNEFDFAILDINLHGEMVYPLADDLFRRGIPFLFLTGYAAAALPEAFRAVPHVPKPYNANILANRMGSLLGLR